jgi:pimeloyl-ACP methyl ester carboxylesterase
MDQLALCARRVGHVQIATLIAASMLAQSSGATAQTPQPQQELRILEQLTGHWSGYLERGGVTAGFELDLRVRDGALTGTFNWPELGYLGAELIGVRLSDGAVRISVPLPLGALRLIATPGTAHLVGRLEETTRRANDWVALPVEGTFSLQRSRSARLPYGVTSIHFASGAVELAGQIYTPRGRGRRPGVVFIHGSGDSNRADGAFYADQFARAGVVTLVYDKRGVGESSGQWRNGGYVELAQDAHAALEFLRTRAGVDPSRVGYVARSEGAWVAPLAVRLGGASFLAAISGPTVAVADEDIDHYRVALREAGLTEARMQPAFALVRLRHRVIGGQASAADLEQAVAAQRHEPWFSVLAWGDAEADPAERIFRSRTIGFDPALYLANLGVPSYWVYGSDDVIIPAGDSAARLMALHIEPRPYITILPRADHALAVTDYPRLPGGVKRPARLLADWINAL